MGIEVPDTDDTIPPSGLYCPIVGPGDMSNLIITFTGIAWQLGIPRPYDPNGTYHLTPYSTCEWRKTSVISPYVSLLIIVNYAPSMSHVAMIELPSYRGIYSFVATYVTVYGQNSTNDFWRYGTHQIVTRYAGTFGSVTDLAAGLGISADRSTFVEPMGVNQSVTKEDLRIARQRDGTCVYIQRP